MIVMREILNVKRLRNRSLVASIARWTGALRDAARNPALAISESRFTPAALSIDDNIRGYLEFYSLGRTVYCRWSQHADRTEDVGAVDLARGT
jgi:hypothetical protein